MHSHVLWLEHRTANRVPRDYLGLVRNELHVFEAVYAPRFNPGIEDR